MQTIPSLQLARRNFLAAGTSGMLAFLLGCRSIDSIAQNKSRLFGELPGPLLPPDANGLRLPAGFQSRIIARSGQPVVAGSDYRWHQAPDGGACFATADGGWIYVSNSEIKRTDGNGGGVGAVRFDAQGVITSAYPMLQNTDNNCAGGATPWQSWLSCEEVDRGLVYECDPFGTQPAVAREALGAFKHEAVAVDTEHGHLYLTEDERDGCFYRFIPAQPLPALGEGMLEVAEVITSDNTSRLVWHPVPDPSAKATPTRHQVAKATHFNGGEGIAFYAGSIYFTTKGDNRVWMADTRAQTLAVLYDIATSTTPILRGVDNLIITAAGDVLVAEDGGDMQIVLLTAAGELMPIVQVEGHPESEICGPAFDPGFQRLYFSSQRGPGNRNSDGITYEISQLQQG